MNSPAGKKALSLNALFSKESDGGYSVSVPHLPGCVSQGDTFEEALANIKEAMELYLEDDATFSEDEVPTREFLAPVEIYAHR